MVRGDSYVPDHTELGNWCQVQRGRCRRGYLSKEKEEALMELGFDFYGNEDCCWHAMLGRLREFKENNGDCLVPPPVRLGCKTFCGVREDDGDVDEGQGLGYDDILSRWVSRQRTERRIYDNIIDEAPVGCWGPRAIKTKKRKMCAGDTSCDEEDNEKTGNARSVERNQEVVKDAKDEGNEEPDSYLSPEMIQALDTVGFYWENDIHMTWIRNYRRLAAFKHRHGHARVTKGMEGVNRRFYMWNSWQRTHYKQSIEGKPSPLTAAKQKFLEDISFVFELTDLPPTLTFDERLEMLQEFLRIHGHCLVPQKHPTLGDWVKRTRQAYEYKLRGVKGRRGTFSLTEKRITQLNAIGFVWKVRPGRAPIRLFGKDDDPKPKSPWPETKSEAKAPVVCDPQAEVEQLSEKDEEGERGDSYGSETDIVVLSNGHNGDEADGENYCAFGEADLAYSEGGDKQSRSPLDWVQQKGLSHGSQSLQYHQGTNGGGETVDQMVIAPSEKYRGLYHHFNDLGSVAIPEHASQLHQTMRNTDRFSLNSLCSVAYGDGVCQSSALHCGICRCHAFRLTTCVPCGHGYCRTCLDLVLSKYERRCPICGSFITRTSELLVGSLL